MITYIISNVGEHPYIKCLSCSMISYNANDIKFRYCGHCHIFHEDAEKLSNSVRFPGIDDISKSVNQ